jgi:acetyltransferase-like isoleucine patch superfamily enzyme
MPRVLKTDPLFEVGAHSYGFEGTDRMFGPEEQIIVGKYCSAAADVKLISGGNHPMHVGTFPFKSELVGPWQVEDGWSKGPILIGHDVWLGNGSTLLSGISIGSGSVVGAGAVVAASFPPYSLIVGSPAKLARQRFSDSIIDALLKISWWDWPDEKVVEHIDEFYGPVEAFVEKHL